MEENLTGMSPADAKAYLIAHVTTLKLTEKQCEESAAEESKWRGRVELARAKGIADLALEAEKQADVCGAKTQTLRGEIAELRAQIEAMRTQLPGLAARERSVDPDLLEQELLISRGYLPGDEAKADTDLRMRELERSAAVDAELEALKATMAR
ncbi:MAG: chromosome partitioning protein [Treponema sp.]|jgi:phage shock protein A|nr:chromosome partitioning protein [Treponema sp.]